MLAAKNTGTAVHQWHLGETKLSIEVNLSRELQNGRYNNHNTYRTIVTQLSEAKTTEAKLSLGRGLALAILGQYIRIRVLFERIADCMAHASAGLLIQQQGKTYKDTGHLRRTYTRMSSPYEAPCQARSTSGSVVEKSVA